MSPALNGSSVIRRFKGSNAFEIRDGITFDFYTGWPHVCNEGKIVNHLAHITFEKTESANSHPFAQNRCLFMWGAYFCMGAYKRDVVAEIKMGAYIHGVLILCRCLLSQFYGMSINPKGPVLRV